jgi:hypothetical protein
MFIEFTFAPEYEADMPITRLIYQRESAGRKTLDLDAQEWDELYRELSDRIDNIRQDGRERLPSKVFGICRSRDREAGTCRVETVRKDSCGVNVTYICKISESLTCEEGQEIDLVPIHRINETVSDRNEGGGKVMFTNLPMSIHAIAKHLEEM